MDKFTTKGDLCVASESLGLFSCYGSSENYVDSNQDKVSRPFVSVYIGQDEKNSENLRESKLQPLALKSDGRDKIKKISTIKSVVAAHVFDLFVIIVTFLLTIIGVEYIFFEGSEGLVRIVYMISSLFHYNLFIPLVFVFLYLVYLVYRTIFIKISKRTLGEVFYKL